MTFRIAQSLSTESSHAGDRFQATLVGDVSSGAGSVLIPSGALANGVVVVAEESPSSDVPAVLELRLESLEVDGEVRTLRGAVIAADVKSDTRDSGSATAAKVAVGTAAGALVGQIIGRDTRGTLIGAGAGAVAGTAVAVTTNDGHAKIEEGGTLTVLLDEPIALR
jgi:hypothetical protein